MKTCRRQMAIIYLDILTNGGTQIIIPMVDLRRTCLNKSVSWTKASLHFENTQTALFRKRDCNKTKRFPSLALSLSIRTICSRLICVCSKQTNDMAKRNNNSNSNNLFDKCVITEQIKTKTKPSNFMSFDFLPFVHHLIFFCLALVFRALSFGMHRIRRFGRKS